MITPVVSAFHRRLVLSLFAASLIINFWALTRYWNQSLRDGHEGRQEHTALTAYYFQKDGLRLAYETPLLGPPWSIPMEFPLYQGVTAELSKVTGWPLEQTGRAVSVFFFYASLLALWLLLRRHLPGALDRMLVVTYVLVCPLYLFYSRTFLIESTALCLSLWFLLLFDRMVRRPGVGCLLAVWTLGALATTTKITTFAALVVATGLLVLEQVLARRRIGQAWGRALGVPLGLSVLAVAVPLIAGIAWVKYADHIKEGQPYAHLLTSSSLREFNFGTLAQRFSANWGRKIGAEIVTTVLSLPGLLVLLVAGWISTGAHRRIALACLACFPAGVLLFANLYYVHDYYFYASAYFILAAMGALIAGALHNPRIAPVFAASLALVAFGGELYAFRQTYYNFYLRPNPPVPIEAEIIKAITPPDDAFAGFGVDWDPVWPYYSQRRAIIPFQSHFENFAAFDASITGLNGRRLSTMFLSRNHRDDSRYTITVAQKLEMCAQPIARTPLMDIYVRRDLATAAVRALMARTDWGVELNLKPDPDVVVLQEQHDLRTHDWTGPRAITSPLPLLSKGPVEIGILPLDNKLVISTQAPTEIHFQPPPGSRSIEAIGGMVPSSYTEGHTTPGVVVVVFEEKPDGTRHMIFKRELNPLTVPSDRGDVHISYQQEKPFTGTLVFAHYAIPSGNVSYSWSYWKRINIH